MVSLRFFTKIIISFAVVTFADRRPCRNELEREKTRLERFLKHTPCDKRGERNILERFESFRAHLTSVLSLIPSLGANKVFDDFTYKYELYYKKELYDSMCEH